MVPIIKAHFHWNPAFLFSLTVVSCFSILPRLPLSLSAGGVPLEKFMPADSFILDTDKYHWYIRREHLRQDWSWSVTGINATETYQASGKSYLSFNSN